MISIDRLLGYLDARREQLEEDPSAAGTGGLAVVNEITAYIRESSATR